MELLNWCECDHRRFSQLKESMVLAEEDLERERSSDLGLK